jgi:Na+-transporting methylmalonyl-CoA/oxaloacetate decarboxylase beta subunit
MKTLKVIAIISGFLTFKQFVLLISYLTPFGWKEVASIGIIGSADGPTAIYFASPFKSIIRYGLLTVSALIAIMATVLIVKKKSQ